MLLAKIYLARQKTLSVQIYHFKYKSLEEGAPYTDVVIDQKEVRNTILSMIVPVAQENSPQVLAGFITIAIVGRPLDTDISAQELSSHTFTAPVSLSLEG